MEVNSFLMTNGAWASHRTGNIAGGRDIDPAERKLRKAASDFEALLLSKWWSAMKQSGLPGTDEETDPGHDTLDELGMQAMSTAVAAGRGIGLGSMLVHYLLSNVHGAGAKTTEAGGESTSLHAARV